MVDGGAVVEAVNGVEGHGLVGAEEDRRFIHIVPEAGDAHGDKVFVEAAPPFPRASQSEIREHAVAGPHLANKNRAIGILDEHVVLDAGVVRRVAVARVFFDVQVGDENRVEALCAKISNHLLESREILAVNGKGSITLLIVDVEIDNIGGDSFFAKSSDNFAGARFRVVAVSTLLIAKRPQWGEERTAGQGRVFFDDFLGFRTGNEVVIQLTGFGAKGKVVPAFLSEIENASVGVVEENPVSDPFTQPNEERDGLVERIGRFLPAKLVGVPVGEDAVAAIHGPSLVAKAIVIFLGRHFLPNMHARAVPCHGQAGFVGQQDVSGGIREINQQRGFFDSGDRVARN